MTQKSDKKVQFDKQEDSNKDNNLEEQNIITLNKRSMEDILGKFSFKKKRLFSINEISILENITINNKSLIDNTNINLFYEIILYYIQMLNNGFDSERGFPLIVHFLKNSEGDVKNIYFSLSLFDELKKKIEYNLDITLRSNTYEKGIYQCKNPKCLSDEVTFIRKQTRCSDEPDTAIITCQKCGRTRNIN